MRGEETPGSDAFTLLDLLPHYNGQPRRRGRMEEEFHTMPPAIVVHSSSLIKT